MRAPAAVPPAPPQPAPAALARAAASRDRRLARHGAVWAMTRDGWSSHAIARHLGIGRATVVRYRQHEVFSERKGPLDTGRGLLEPWKLLILERWNSGQRHGRRLFRELQELGYAGSHATFARYTRRLRLAQDAALQQWASIGRDPPHLAEACQRPIAPRSAAWLMLRIPKHRDAVANARLDRIRAWPGALGEAVGLAETFADLVRARAPARLDPWLRQVQGSSLSALNGFAVGLGRDYEAVRAALTTPWSNGPVEGLINRLKMIKRHMYGRANLDLLGRRFILTA